MPDMGTFRGIASHPDTPKEQPKMCGSPAKGPNGPIKVKGPDATGPDAPAWMGRVNRHNTGLGFNPDGSKKAPGSTTGGTAAATPGATPVPTDKLIGSTSGGTVLGG
jgi:hypothetical protein